MGGAGHPTHHLDEQQETKDMSLEFSYLDLPLQHLSDNYHTFNEKLVDTLSILDLMIQDDKKENLILLIKYIIVNKNINLNYNRYSK